MAVDSSREERSLSKARRRLMGLDSLIASTTRSLICSGVSVGFDFPLSMVAPDEDDFFSDACASFARGLKDDFEESERGL